MIFYLFSYTLSFTVISIDLQSSFKNNVYDGTCIAELGYNIDGFKFEDEEKKGYGEDKINKRTRKFTFTVFSRNIYVFST